VLKLPLPACMPDGAGGRVRPVAAGPIRYE
jgi:hypothetical protein